MKRLFDLTAATLGLVVLTPTIVVIALLIKVTDPGPAFFVHGRVGRGGRRFGMWKFRSMRVDAERMGPQITVANDPRVTTVGRWLRRLKFDEFPQLFNVVRGDMSLVGPRPEVERYVQTYGPNERPILDLRPGITDPASFAFYDEEAILARADDPQAFYVERLIPAKAKLNLDYAARRTLGSDLLLIIATVLKPFGVRIDVLGRLGLERPPEATA